MGRTTVPREEKQTSVTVEIPTNNADEVSTRMILSEDSFMAMLYLERRRAERGKKRFCWLMWKELSRVSRRTVR